MTVKAIIFDLGGTYLTHVYGFVHRAAAKYYHVPLTRASTVVEENLPPLFRDEITEETYWKRVGKLLGNPRPPRLFWTGCYPSQAKVKPKMLNLVKRLKKQGYVVGALTNTLKSHQAFNEYAGRLRIFDRVFSSTKLQLAKPDPAIYLAVIRSLRLKPHEILFIDDQPLNIQSAKATGMQGIIFRSPAKTERQLKKIL